MPRYVCTSHRGGGGGDNKIYKKCVFPSHSHACVGVVCVCVCVCVCQCVFECVCDGGGGKGGGVYKSTNMHMGVMATGRSGVQEKRRCVELGKARTQDQWSVGGMFWRGTAVHVRRQLCGHHLTECDDCVNRVRANDESIPSATKIQIDRFFLLLFI